MISYKEKIIKYRKLKNLTQTQFAEKMSVSRSYIAQIEGGKIEPSKGFMDKMIEVFDLNKKFFFIDDEQNLNVELIENNVHLISNDNVHLIDYNNIDSVTMLQILNSNYTRLSNLYQRLIDVKLMTNKQSELNVEEGLLDYIKNFADVKNVYFNDLICNTDSGFGKSKTMEFTDFELLNKKELQEYYNKLINNVNLFEFVFFEFFRKFYREYMSEWYTRNNKKNFSE
ncbi:hypothetical protein AX766_04230 [Flavobacterium covae]|uniref:helix-turn-helix domain-containing protein n=1 Tax=Flavobacterium covae TaxID=2906076 RepID=UPI0007C1F0AC|nr:helix-turn-helix transcriptional regulator [Flavobacterium covae]AND63641.1 hypothetical protein AX766_04070 [Flavobacterium covae]AND63672.1 hypothetical protein AX766_04230 [Flavobacterium covae]